MKNYFHTLVWLSLLLFSTPLIKGSDLVSISSLIKEEKKIYVLGITHNHANEPDSSVLTIYKNFLSNLSSSPTQTLYILDTSKELIQRMASESNNYIQTTLYEVSLDNASHENFKSGSLEYRTCSDILTQISNLRASTSDFFSPEYLNTFGSCDPLLKAWLNDKVITFLKHDITADPFFSEKKDKEKFSSLKTIMLTLINIMPRYQSIKDYLDLLKRYDEKLKNLPENSLIAPLKKEWPNAVEKARCYLGNYSTSKESKLLEVQLNLMEKKQSYLAGNDAFQLVQYPMCIIESIECLLELSNAILECDKLLITLHPMRTNPLIDCLKKKGFKETSIGFIPSEIIDLVRIDTRFSDSAIDTYLTSIVHDTFSMQNASLKNTIECFYFDDQSKGFVADFPKNMTKQACSSCALVVETYKAFATTPTSLYCSLKCLMTSLFKQETASVLLSKLLDEKHTLSIEEKLILKQFGALCFLQAALLMPSLAHEKGTIYQLPLNNIISCLEKILDCPGLYKSDAWKNTLALCSSWNIDVNYIKIFLSMYKKAKDTHLKALLNTNTSYENLGNLTSRTFSENDTVNLIGNQLFAKLKNEFTFSSGTDNNSLLFIYRYLVKRIHKRVGISFDHIEDLLAITYEQNNLEAILAYIGYEKNPLTLPKRPKKSPEMCTFNGEEDSTSSEETPYSYTNKTYEEPSTTTASSTTSATSTTSNEDGFRTVFSSRKKLIRTIKASYGGKPYTISLFKTRAFLPNQLRETLTNWKACERTKESKRIQLIFALAHRAEEQKCSFYYNSYGSPAFAFTDENYHESIREKLDLDHLFSRTVDTFLHSYGIAEQIDNLIQVSIPGEIIYEGIKKVGFFQYSFTPEWVCIHRCFKSYDGSSTDAHVSRTLKMSLYNFLINECSIDTYAAIIKDLKESLGCSIITQ